MCVLYSNIYIVSTFDYLIMQILRTVLIWLKQDFQCRKVHSLEQLQKIRLGVIPADLLFDIIMKELPDLLSVPECYRMVERIFAGDKKDLKQMYTTRTTITVGLSRPTTLIIVSLRFVTLYATAT